MAGGFQTGIPTMQTAAQHVDEVNQAVQARLRSLKSQVEATMDGYKGSGAASWRLLMQRYDDDAQKINTALKNIATRMRTSKTAYEDAQRRVREANSRIQNRLTPS